MLEAKLSCLRCIFSARRTRMISSFFVAVVVLSLALTRVGSAHLDDADTYAIKYFLSKFFLSPVTNDIDPDK